MAEGLHHAIAPHTAEAAREVPEHHLQPHINPCLVNDRHIHGQVARTPYGTPEHLTR